ncbi:hypothetical protein QJQ45_019596, partial [Haematococcus lacustris]
VKPQLKALSQVSSKPSSLASYRRFADTVLATYDAKWTEVSKPRWANAKFRLYCAKQCVVARSWSKGMLKEALKQFPAGRVVMVDEFRTSQVSSANNTPSETLLGTPSESFTWLQPVYSKANRSQVRGLICTKKQRQHHQEVALTANKITVMTPGSVEEERMFSAMAYLKDDTRNRLQECHLNFYDRDVSAALNIRRCAVGPGPRPTELCYWEGRPAMPKLGQPG